MRGKGPVVLVLYYTRGVFPLRETIHTHLRCWERHARGPVAYINVAFGMPWDELHALEPDIIILHTSLCGIRWGDDPYRRFVPLLGPLRDFSALIVAMPQDEFVHTDRLVSLLRVAGVDVVLSCAGPEAWSVIYGDFVEEARFLTVLTGYLEDSTVEAGREAAKPLADRQWAITYRAWRAPAWLGKLGRLKVAVGETAHIAAKEQGLAADISLDNADTIAGRDWLDFLGDSLAVVGVEGGASLIDRDGSLKAAVEAFESANPDADFAMTEAACFPGRDGELPLRALSPRHLEAVATRTVQILVRGEYNGLLEADRHYIPVSEDLSDMDAAVARLADLDACQAMVETAYHDVITRGQATYNGFVQRIEREVFAPALADREDEAPIPSQFAVVDTLNTRDAQLWEIIAEEVESLTGPDPYGPAYKARESRIRALGGAMEPPPDYRPPQDPKALWVVCAHPPHRDPRIGWSAATARSLGWDVSVYGLSHVGPPQKAARPNIPETVFEAPPARMTWPSIAKGWWNLGVRPPGWIIALGILGGVLMSPLLVVWAMIWALSRGLKNFRRAILATRPVIRRMVQRLPRGRTLWNIVAHAWRVLRNRALQPLGRTLSPRHAQSLGRRLLRHLTRGRLGERWLALEGYRWYLGEHGLRFARDLVREATLRGMPAVVHAHDPDALLAASALKARMGCRIVYDAHESGPDAYLLRPWPRALFGAIERVGLSHADAVVTVSDPLASILRERTQKFVGVVPNASLLEEMDFVALENHEMQDDPRLVVLFQGGFSPERGLDRVIREWVSVGGAVLCLRGPDGPHREALTELATELGLLGKSVIFLPSLPEDELIAGAAFADVGLVPYATDVENHRVACPNKLCQFMMAGLAVLSTPMPYVMGILAESGCGQVYDDTTPGALAEAVNAMARDRAATVEMGVRARHHARCDYHYEAFADVLKTAYSAPT